MSDAQMIAQVSLLLPLVLLMKRCSRAYDLCVMKEKLAVYTGCRLDPGMTLHQMALRRWSIRGRALAASWQW